MLLRADRFSLQADLDLRRYNRDSCVICKAFTHKACGRCVLPRYCSKDCQRLDWHRRHKHACKELKGGRLHEKQPYTARRIRSPPKRSRDHLNVPLHLSHSETMACGDLTVA